MRSALTDANGFPLTRTVKVSSFSDVIRLPNHDFLVNSGDDSGVRPTSSDDACSFLLWNLGEPKKLFLIVVSRERQ